MNWPWLRRGDIGGIVLVAILFGAILVVLLVFPQLGQRRNFGFGPEWDCQRMEKGDPICVKQSSGQPSRPGNAE